MVVPAATVATVAKLQTYFNRPQSVKVMTEKTEIPVRVETTV